MQSKQNDWLDQRVWHALIVCNTCMLALGDPSGVLYSISTAPSGGSQHNSCSGRLVSVVH